MIFLKYLFLLILSFNLSASGLGKLEFGADDNYVTLGNPLPTRIIDANHSLVNRFVSQDTAVVTTVAVETAINDTTIEVADSTGIIVGDYVYINTTTIESTIPRVTAVNANVLTLDRRLDKVHFVGDTVTEVILDMATTGQTGTLAAPQEYAAGSPPGEIWHITRIMVTMGHGTAGDLGLFGNLAELTNGVLIRTKVSGNYNTVTNWKTNAAMKIDMYDVQFDARSGGGGTFGTSARGSFSDTGVSIRLDGDQNDAVEVYVQDNVTALDFFGLQIQGHVAEE